MNANPTNGWRAIQQEVLRRIRTRQWKPGDLLPSEPELCDEFGCARATVNRALRSLADEGWLDRKRKAGTRVAVHPVRKATLTIPIIRHEITRQGYRYQYRRISQAVKRPPVRIRKAMGTESVEPMLHLQAIHLADGRPYVLEDRWIQLCVVPAALDADFSTLSPNEWLVEQVPFTDGHMIIGAAQVPARQAERLACKRGDSLLYIERTTRNATDVITHVRLTYHAGYQLQTDL